MRTVRRIALAAGALILAAVAGSPVLAAPRGEAAQAIGSEEPAAAVRPASDAVARFADWVTASGDNAGLPFVIVDKVAAEVAVFDAQGRHLGAAPALLGAAVGDDSVPGIGDKALSAIAPEERTTPAGRFLAFYGPAADGRTVLWVDFATAISLHPVVFNNPKERRAQRLRSETPEDNRITYGCINVAGWFYEEVVRPTLSGTRSVVYVLPETRDPAEVFPALDARPQQAAADPPPEARRSVLDAFTRLWDRALGAR